MRIDAVAAAARDAPVPQPPAQPAEMPASRGDGIVTSATLATSAARAARIARGDAQVRTVDGVALRYPSQRLDLIESSQPFRRGQTHVLAKHVGQSFADDVARIERDPSHPSAAGGFTDRAAAQRAVDETIAAPRNQRAIGAFLASGSARVRLAPVDFERTIGTLVKAADVRAGAPRLYESHSAAVVLVRDASFPEGYRVLTAYPT